jgi:hypothetical protein
MLKKVFIFGVLLVCTSCGIGSSKSVETKATPIASTGTGTKSFAEFQVCYPLEKIREIRLTISKVEQGLLSKQDLAEGLSSLSIASELATLFIGDVNYYQKNPEFESFLPVQDFESLKKRTTSDGNEFARIRVRLIDTKFIDIQKLENLMNSLEQYLSNYCSN